MAAGGTKAVRDIHDRDVRFVGVVRMRKTGVGMAGVASGWGGRRGPGPGIDSGRQGQVREADRHQDEATRRRRQP